MSCIGMIRLVIGLVFVLYGLILKAYHKFSNVKNTKQVNKKVSSSFIFIAIGIIISSYSIVMLFAVSSGAIFLYLLESIILNKI